MDAGKVILERIGMSLLVGFAASELRYGKTDRKTHYGYLEFTTKDQPRLPGVNKVRIELALDDSCTIKVLDQSGKSELNKIEKVYCDDLVDTLFEIIG